MMSKKLQQPTLTGRVVAHIDMDCFYVQVERSLNPELRGKPVAVVQYNPFGDLATLKPSDNRIGISNGSLIAVSYEARAVGVKRIMRGNEAKAVCPDLIMIQVPTAHGKADLSIYRDAGSKVVQLLQQQGKFIIEKASIDEVYLDLTQEVEGRIAAFQDGLLQSAVDIFELASTSLVAGEDIDELKMEKSVIRNGHSGTQGKSSSHKSSYFQKSRSTSEERNLCFGAAIVAELRELIFKSLGFSCSAGIAHNKMLAKIASSMHKPAKQTIVPSCIVSSLMENMPISRVPGFGGKLGEALSTLDATVVTFGDIRRIDERVIRDKFGDDIGTKILNSSKGIDTELVKQRSLCQAIGCGKSFTHQKSLNSKSLDDGVVLHWLNELSKELMERVESDTEMNLRKPKNLTIGVSIGSARDGTEAGGSALRKDLQQVSSLPAQPGGDATTIAITTSSAAAHTIMINADPKQVEYLAIVPSVESTHESEEHIIIEENSKVEVSTGGWEGRGDVSISRICPMPTKWALIGATALTAISKAIQDSKRRLPSNWTIRYLSLSATHFEDMVSEGRSISRFFAKGVAAENMKGGRSSSEAAATATATATAASLAVAAAPTGTSRESPAPGPPRIAMKSPAICRATTAQQGMSATCVTSGEHASTVDGISIRPAIASVVAAAANSPETISGVQDGASETTPPSESKSVETSALFCAPQSSSSSSRSDTNAMKPKPEYPMGSNVSPADAGDLDPVTRAGALGIDITVFNALPREIQQEIIKNQELFYAEQKTDVSLIARSPSLSTSRKRGVSKNADAANQAAKKKKHNPAPAQPNQLASFFPSKSSNEKLSPPGKDHDRGHLCPPLISSSSSSSSSVSLSQQLNSKIRNSRGLFRYF